MTGGRTFDDVDRIRDALTLYSRFYDDIGLLHGDAPGADRLAAQVAVELGWKVKAFPADWTGPCRPSCAPSHRTTTHGRSVCPAAGNYRNQHMVDLLVRWGRSHGVSVIAFPGGNGTADMVARATAADIAVSEL